MPFVRTSTSHDSDSQAATGDEKGTTYSGKDQTDPNGISAQTASHRFLSWVKSLDDHWPIIVMSHIPLHADRGDNTGAWIWTRTLNEAAENHDIVFLWGHNHTLERTEDAKRTEQANYLLFPGENITVQSWDLDEDGKIIVKRKIPVPEEEQAKTTEDGTKHSADKGQEPEYVLITQDETLSFVYMNAGYITQGVGSLLTFTDRESDGIWDSLTVKRYLLDRTKADPISEMSENNGVSLPLRDWNDPADVPEKMAEPEQPAA